MNIRRNTKKRYQIVFLLLLMIAFINVNALRANKVEAASVSPMPTFCGRPSTYDVDGYYHWYFYWLGFHFDYHYVELYLNPTLDKTKCDGTSNIYVEAYGHQGNTLVVKVINKITNSVVYEASYTVSGKVTKYVWDYSEGIDDNGNLVGTFDTYKIIATFEGRTATLFG